jgi:hypothetical protein
MFVSICAAAGRILQAPTTAYVTGDRTASITVTASFTPEQGTLDNLVDGSFVGNGTGGILASSSGATNGFSTTFDFGSLKYVNELKIYNVAARAGVICHFEASPDNSTWTTVSTSIDLSLAATTTATITMQPEGYRYLKIVYDGGNWTVNYWTEMEFKLANGAT